MSKRIGLVALCALLVTAFWLHRNEHVPIPEQAASFDLRRILGGTDHEGFTRAVETRPFAFPADHGPHPDFRSEWWYFTGNLKGKDGRRFGYQWTLFRFALRPEASTSRSAWAARHVYMGHFTVTDSRDDAFYAYERFTRAALGMAGAQPAPFRIWIDDWSVAQDDKLEVWRLYAATPEVVVDLNLTPTKPVVLQGDRGLSQKSAVSGNASYYYSIPRLVTRGTLAVNGEEHAVEGNSWLDREWSTSVLTEAQAGWDWFGLQLSDETELMYYRIRRKDGTADPHSQGSFIDTQGQAVPLALSDVDIAVQDTWQSPRGVRYPSRWRLTVKPLALSLEIIPLVANQELNLSLRYWEGAVRFTGTRAGRPVSGYGYVELTGYEAMAPAAQDP